MFLLKKTSLLLMVVSMAFTFSFATAARPLSENTNDADDAAEKEKPMFTEKVEVLGNVPVEKAIQSVSLFKAEEIKKFNFINLKSVLSLTPGVLNLSNGSFGQSSSLSIRGSKSSQVLYVVDGIKLRDGAGISGVDLSTLSPNVLDKIEVVRGPLSSIYGSDAMGGVVSLNTFSREGANLTASYGSHNSYMGNFSGSTRVKDFTLGLSVNTQRYTDNVVNDIFKNTGLIAKINYKKNNLDGGLRFFGSFTNSGIPFNNPGASSPNRKYKRNFLIFAAPFTVTLNERSKVNVKLSFSNSRYDFEDPDDTYNSFYATNFKNLEGEVIYSTHLFEKLKLDAGVDYSDQTIASENVFGDIMSDLKRNYVSTYANTGLNLNALQFSASVRYDKYKDVTGNVSPQVGVSYLIANMLKLRAAYSHSFLAPGVTHQVNPWGAANFDLKPEKGKSIEIGAEYYSNKVVLAATYFNTRYEDMIDWQTIDFTTYEGQYRNISNVDTYGIELSATLRPVSRLTLTASYSYLHTEDKETGEPLPRKPKNTFSGFAAYTGKYFTFSLNMVYVGKRPDLDYSNWPPDVESPAFNTFDINLVVPVFESISIFGKVTNAFDKEYAELFGYTAPGRRFEFGFKYKIK